MSALDVDQVLGLKGYEGTSLPDLTEAMGINRPSLYAAFGNEEAFCRARRSIATPTGRRPIFARPWKRQPPAAVVERLLRGAVNDLLTDPRHPPGCLVVQGALSCGDAAEPIRQELVARRKAGEAAIRQRFERAISDGDLPADANAADLARFIATVTVGMAVQAAGGASRDELQRVARIALRSWPEARRGHETPAGAARRRRLA